jgi:hypothetical protein
MTHGEDAVCALLDAMNACDLDYMIVGSFSSNAYGEARSTKDADFVVRLGPGQREALLGALPNEFVVDPSPTSRPSPATHGKF